MHPIAMKRSRSLPFRIFLCPSEKWVPNLKGHSIVIVTVITSTLYLFPPEANAQRVLLDVPLEMQPSVPKNTDLPASVDRPVKSARFISGVILDTSGTALPGATVMLLPISEKVGAVAGIEGDFTFEIPSSYTNDSLELRISLVGFITQVRRLSLLQENYHIEVCLANNHRYIGCPHHSPSGTKLISTPSLKATYTLLHGSSSISSHLWPVPWVSMAISTSPGLSVNCSPR